MSNFMKHFSVTLRYRSSFEQSDLSSSLLCVCACAEFCHCVLTWLCFDIQSSCLFSDFKRCFSFNLPFNYTLLENDGIKIEIKPKMSGILFEVNYNLFYSFSVNQAKNKYSRSLRRCKASTNLSQSVRANGSLQQVIQSSNSVDFSALLIRCFLS